VAWINDFLLFQLLVQKKTALPLAASHRLLEYLADKKCSYL